MKTIKISEATNTQLDWLVAKCEGHTQETTVFPNGVRSPRVFIADGGVAFDARTGAYLDFTTNWSQMGPIIEREGVHLFQPVDSHFKPLSTWVAALPYNATSTLKRCSYGPTPLIAVARCYVASKLGGTVEIPEELT